MKIERKEIKEGEGLGFCFEKGNKRNKRRRWGFAFVLKIERKEIKERGDFWILF